MPQFLTIAAAAAFTIAGVEVAAKSGWDPKAVLAGVSLIAAGIGVLLRVVWYTAAQRNDMIARMSHNTWRLEAIENQLREHVVNEERFYAEIRAELKERRNDGK